MIIKPYPKDNESRTFGVRPAWLDEVAEHIRVRGIGRDELLFSTEVGTPISRNTFRTRVWLPAVKASGIDFGFGSMIFGTRTRRGFSLAARISRA